MSSRDFILANVRKNLPQPKVPLPDLDEFRGKRTDISLGYMRHFTHLAEVDHASVNTDLLTAFQKQLEAMGGKWFSVADAAGIAAKMRELFPQAKVVCSAVPEVPGTRRVENVKDPHELNDVDVGVVRSPLGVAEAGAVWLTQSELVVNALGVLSQHLIVLLEPSRIVATMHDAYELLALGASPYGLFMAGPSATGDIEGVIIHGAQGARTLTVLFIAPGEGGRRKA